MKRVISIIIILIIVIGIFLTGAWLIARHTAQQNNTPVPTFRQFLTGDTGTGAPLTPNTGDLSSVFVDDNLGNTTSGQTIDTTPGTQVAQFTNGTTSPNNGTNGTGQQGTGGNGTTTVSPNGTTTTTTPGTTPGTVIVTTTTPNGTTTTTTTTADPTTQAPAPVPTSVPGPACTDADLNIQFTTSELAQLQVLQNRFYAVAQTLHTDADVATEVGNHDNFKAKVATVEGLYNFCTQKANLITNPAYTKRIPTPFWHSDGVFGTDSELLVSTDGPYDGAFPGGTSTDPDDPLLSPANTAFGMRSLERSLRLNLW